MPEPAHHLAQQGGGHEPPTGSGSGGKPPVVMAKDEIRAMLHAIEGPQAVRDRALIWMAYTTAARASELCGMEWQGIDWARGRCRFWRRKVSGWHDVPLDLPQCVGALQALAREQRVAGRTIAPLSGPVFLSQRGGVLTPNGIWRIVKRWGGRAGIETGKARPHVLRASRATHLIEDGAALLAVKHLLGHRSITSTERYTRVAAGWLDGELGKSSL